MSETFHTSDQHVMHTLMARLRGYDSVAAHDEAIAEAWCETVRSGDTVFVQGDISVVRGVERLLMILAFFAKLPGTKHLIAGNHDQCHSMHRDSHKLQGLYLPTFASVQVFARRKIAGRTVMLSHFPYAQSVDGTASGNAHGHEARYPQYRLPDTGNWLLHGHTHSTERVSGPRSIHIGVDAWDLKPVAVGQIAEIMSIAERDTSANTPR